MAAAELRHGEDDGDDAGQRVESSFLLLSADLLLPGDAFLSAAVALKEKVVETTWKSERHRERPVDPTLYTGLMGTAFACLRSFEATGSPEDLLLCSEIADTCAAVARCSKSYLTFLCGCAGVYALGAVAADRLRDRQRRDLFLGLFFEGGFGMPYDLLHGRSGFLWAALFVRKHLGPGSRAGGGRAGAAHAADCPLVYRRYGTRYWGAAHGLAGIMQVLLHFPLAEDDLDAVKETLRYACYTRQLPTNEGNPRDGLVQWAHGAGGMAVVLCKASEVFPEDPDFRDAAVEAGEVVWRRGLVRKVGLCDGTAGNAYSFLSLYRLTGETVFLERARAFASFLYHNAEKLVGHGQQHGGEHAYSLFRGLAGPACLWFDMISPENARFPGFEI
ncbi:unnamed protein product [Spirodela intermedia]|uniref:Uncharacterized protein n=1 Tax=Spirodela intermedia TaxID=51605 RepID=A0A7I8J4G9_SPIIN|nr:unnamed protein product [Spirodela intermedia]CAA6664999.1 unnamed protein product [Spirodela intermedia]